MNDAVYRRDITQQVLEHAEQQEHQRCNSIIFMDENGQNIEEVFDADKEVETADDIGDIFKPITELDESKCYWNEGATKLMLTCVEEFQQKLGKSITVKTKSKLYKLVSERMAEDNYSFTPTQIQNKFRGMERQYNKIVFNNRQTGTDRQTCPFEKELAQLLGKKKGINPAITLESRHRDGKSRRVSVNYELISDMDQVLSDNTPSCSTQAPKRRKIGTKEEILEKLDKLVEDKREFHKKKLELLKENAEKKLQISQKKLELLEKIANNYK